MKRFYTALIMMIGISPFLLARGPKDRQAEPVFEDAVAGAAIQVSTIGNSIANILYLPRSTRDVRRVKVSNPSSSYVMHISTWQFVVSSVSLPSNIPIIGGGVVNTTASQTTWAIPVSSFGATNFALELPVKTTFYAIFEVGGPTIPVRVLELFDDPTKY